MPSFRPSNRRTASPVLALLAIIAAAMAPGAAAATVPSAVHQYTERPPGGASGSLGHGKALVAQKRDRGPAAADRSGASAPSSPDGAAVGIVAGSGPGDAGTGDPSGGGGQGNGGESVRGGSGNGHGNGNGLAAIDAEQASTGYPVNDLIWIVLALLALALLGRVAVGFAGRTAHRAAD